MNHGSLFSGIGGFDLAAEWMGWDNIFHCEWMPFPRQVLHYHFPNSISYEDITKTDFTIHRGSIDILTGGFPCQPYSSAGKRLGKEDERHLWPHMLRAIQEIEPTYVVGENVRGLTNWNGGVVFEEVCADLENCGYEVQPILLPACAVGAPHRRDRIWFIASNADNVRFNRSKRENEINASQTGFNAFNDTCSNVNGRTSSNANGFGLQRRTTPGNAEKSGKIAEEFLEGLRFGNLWEIFPTEYAVCCGNDGISKKLDGITFSKWRKESLKGYGNAIVPQVAYEIFKTIEHLHNEKL